LSSLFTTPSNTSSCEVILPGMTTTSVFMELPVIVSFIASVKFMQVYSTPASPVFFGTPPGLLFQSRVH
jgi:hypothetical protein